MTKCKVLQNIWSIEHQAYFNPTTPVLDADGVQVGTKQTVVEFKEMNPDNLARLVEMGVLEVIPEPSKPLKKESADG